MSTPLSTTNFSAPPTRSSANLHWSHFRTENRFPLFLKMLQPKGENATMIRVLGRQTSGNVQKVLFLLEELGLKYTREDYGRQFNNTNTDAYREMNPNMKVPTLVDGDTITWESNTILRYLAAL